MSKDYIHLPVIYFTVPIGINVRSRHHKLMLLANMKTAVDLKDKRVAVIGTGSSAIQIVPQVQKVARHVVSFMRSVTW